jgi:uncharacterized protein (DUF433 family)
MSPDSFPAAALERITQNPDILRGKPCIRGLRISVSQVLEMLAAGMTPAEIVEEFPDLEIDDIPACLQFASAVTALGSQDFPVSA